MRAAKFAFLLAAAAGLPAGEANAAVNVSFVQPERYTDATLANGYGEAARAPVLNEIAAYLQQLGQRYLPPGRELTVEILDIDLAGQFEWWRRNAYDTRIMREVTRPRIALRYRLEEKGAVLARAEEALTDPYYLSNQAAQISGDPLRYEKSMLDDWFRARFARK